ncbi:hypothetical protein EDB81DRAFT_378678 [Dactylonectria macrodidyma]|uniref:Uncharacterized protein n=1 Tax=Dactylonectria macrodidyma TaxID=307937 RepID=A0A9P9JDK2_9HYPO|nr:hypothetical protein EDB81DRAFT_378678 [Dactylonectria macrodidyma]
MNAGGLLAVAHSMARPLRPRRAHSADTARMRWHKRSRSGLGTEKESYSVKTVHVTQIEAQAASRLLKSCADGRGQCCETTWKPKGWSLLIREGLEGEKRAAQLSRKCSSPASKSPWRGGGGKKDGRKRRSSFDDLTARPPAQAERHKSPTNWLGPRATAITPSCSASLTTPRLEIAAL